MTPEQIKAEMRKVKIPWFIKVTKKFWFKAGRYIIPFGILAFLPLFIIYNNVSLSVALSMWSWMLGWGGFLALIGLLMLASHLIQKAFVKKQAKRLGISVWLWNLYAKEINLTAY
jgi:hypothetical protein